MVFDIFNGNEALAPANSFMSERNIVNLDLVPGLESPCHLQVCGFKSDFES